MKTIRQDRYREFDQMVDDSKSCVADEMIFISDLDFFKDMSKEEILEKEYDYFAQSYSLFILNF